MGKEEPLTIMSEMQKVQDTLKNITYRAEVLEKNLKNIYLSDDVRETMEKELEEVKQSLAKHNEQMKNLQKENTKSFTVAVAIISRKFTAQHVDESDMLHISFSSQIFLPLQVHLTCNPARVFSLIVVLQ
ncbi:hypothetical protein J437_LFUL003348, partial [Ladona fulva]